MFNPPIGVTNGAEYRYGNIVWEYDAASGVWNIVDGSVVGSQGPKGDQGDAGPAGATGNTGPTGAGATGDGGAFRVLDGFGTVRLSAVAVTGVAGFNDRFDVAGGIVSHKFATTSLTGIASFDPVYFSVTTTGHAKITGRMLSLTDQTKGGEDYTFGSTISIEGATGVAFTKVSKGNYQIEGLTATNSKIGMAFFDSTHFTISATGEVNLASAYQVTGDTVITVAGSGIGIATTGRTDTIYNIGVTSFNGLTGPVVFRIPFGTYAATGSASFDPRFFGIGSTGHLVLTGAYQVTGDTVQAGSAIVLGAGKTIINVGVTSFNGATGAVAVTGGQHGIAFISNLYRSVGGMTASNNFVFDGTSLTFGTASGSKFTITGSNMAFGANTNITGGIYRNPTEAATVYTLNSGTNEVVINGMSGSIQRYNITPNGTVTIKAGSNWHALNTAVETIAVIIKQNSVNGYTGQFDPSILTDGLTRPIFFSPDTITNGAVTGSVAMLTLMRVNKNSVGEGLTMGFVIASGITGAGISIS